MISASQLSIIWNVGMGLFGVAFWGFGLATIVAPAVFLPWSFLLAVIGGLFALFIIMTSRLAGGTNTSIVWDESMQDDSNRAYKFGFTVAYTVYVLAWVLISLGWVSIEAAFPAMGAFTGGSYCLFLGVSGLRGWYETRNAPD